MSSFTLTIDSHSIVISPVNPTEYGGLACPSSEGFDDSMKGKPESIKACFRCALFNWMISTILKSLSIQIDLLLTLDAGHWLKITFVKKKFS